MVAAGAPGTPQDYPGCPSPTRPPANAVAGCLLGRNYRPRRIRAQTSGGATDPKRIDTPIAPAGRPGATPDRCRQIGGRNHHVLPAHPTDLGTLGFRPAQTTGRDPVRPANRSGGGKHRLLSFA